MKMLLTKNSLLIQGLQETGTDMDACEKFLHSIGIAFEWSVDKDTKKLSYHDLTGPEKIVFQKINIKEPPLNFADNIKIENLWKSFIDIFGELKLDYSTNYEVNTFGQNVKKWTEEFLYLYQTSDVTPYVPEFLQLYKNIALFNQQGLEKYNDQASKDYF